jgi:hypothetical protein
MGIVVLSATRLIWNDPLSSPRSLNVAWQLAGKRQLARIRAFSSESGRGVQGRWRRRPQGAKPWRPCSLSDISAAQAAKTTDARGRFDDESR